MIEIMKSQLKQAIAKVGEIGVQDLSSQTLAKLHDLQAMALLPDLGLGYLPWSSFSLRPSALTLVLNELTMNGSRTVIECGIGISTLYMLSARTGGTARLVGIDDDAEWIALVRGYLERMEVPANRYRLIHAPIREYAAEGPGHLWYDTDVINAEMQNFMGDEGADLLLVDGPKGALCERSRYQALPKLKSRLNMDFAVFLDDIHRQDEQEIAEAWHHEHGLKLSIHHEKGGVAILRPENTRKTRSIT